MDLLSLPIVMVENIFSYLTYDEIAKCRIVSKSFNETCMRMLNRGFMMIERRHAIALKNVKAQLPRRESERRYHTLSRHCDILTSIETRISMLNMTYSKFIDNGLCCFIPGKVIDEIRRVLSIVELSKTPPRAHEVLQELRDISSMAIEHFDDKISPAFRRKLQEGVAPPAQRAANTLMVPQVMRQELTQLRRRTVISTKLSLYLASQYKMVYNRMVDYKRMALRQRRTIRDLGRRQKEHHNAIAELKKRIEECDIKYTELTHTNQAGGGKAITASSPPSGGESAAPAQPLRHFGSQIKLDLSVMPIGTSKRTQTKALPNMKPRKPQIKLPSLSTAAEPQPARTGSAPAPAALPSTSQDKPASPKTRSQSTMAKIRGITNEIRHMSKNFEGKLKRPVSLSAMDVTAMDNTKKQKLD